MTVAELIEALKLLPQDAIVLIDQYDARDTAEANTVEFNGDFVEIRD